MLCGLFCQMQTLTSPARVRSWQVRTSETVLYFQKFTVRKTAKSSNYMGVVGAVNIFLCCYDPLILHIFDSFKTKKFKQGLDIMSVEL